MKVFVAGATGVIGRGIVRALGRRGHELTGSARSDEAAKALAEMGVNAVHADLSEPESFEAPARAADAVIQAASASDATSSLTEPRVAAAIMRALDDKRKTFILTSGVWVLGSTGDTPKTEESPLDPAAIVRWRVPVEEAVSKAPTVRGIVIRPGLVYGAPGVLPKIFLKWGKRDGVLRMPGGGNNRWSTVHVDDLGELYAIALEKAEPGALLHGTSGEAIRMEVVARAMAKVVGVGVEPWPAADAKKTLGPLADALMLDQVIQSPRARALGWSPSRPSYASELA